MVEFNIRKCKENNANCEHAYITKGEPCLLYLCMQLRDGKITKDEFNERSSGNYVCCKLDRCCEEC